MIDEMFDAMQARMTVHRGSPRFGLMRCLTVAIGRYWSPSVAIMPSPNCAALCNMRLPTRQRLCKKHVMAQLPFDLRTVEAMPAASIEALIGILSAVRSEICSVIFGAAGFVRSQPDPVSAAQALDVMGGIAAHIFDDIHTHLDALVAQRRAVHAEQDH
jgi:hypothetical protein